MGPGPHLTAPLNRLIRRPDPAARQRMMNSLGEAAMDLSISFKVRLGRRAMPMPHSVSLLAMVATVGFAILSVLFGLLA